MANHIIGAVVGGIAGGIYGGISSYNSAKKLAKAYRNAANDVRNATEQYSGKNAYNSNIEAANQEGIIQNKRALDAQLSYGPNNNAAPMANIANLSGNYEGGYQRGLANNQRMLDAKYNAATTTAQQMMNQAGINFQRDQATQQGLYQGAKDIASIGGAAYDAYKKSNGSTSDERTKEGINNESGLPESDITDSLRQLETISYKYKNPEMEGCDAEKHDSGFTAQSLEKTPLNKKLGIVEEGEDGVKRIDNWKLQEALMAGMAQMQREIDMLTGRNK